MTVHRATRLWLASAASAAALALPAALHAQAFGLNEIGSCALARGFANTASPCKDASTIFWNPAAATGLSGWNFTGGVAAIGINGSFTQDTSLRKYDADVPTQWVPHLFLNYHNPNSKAAYGIGVYVPYGLTSQWHDDFPGRFLAQKASLATVYVQPNFAWQVNKNWSVGGGPIYAHSSVELVQAIDLSSVPTAAVANAPTFGNLGIATGTEFARARLKGSANGWGAQVGVNGTFDNGWSVGARFLAPIEFKYDGADATFTQSSTGLVVGGTLSSPFVAGTPVDSIVAPQFRTGGALVAQQASTKITHPAQIQAGLAYSGIKNWLLEGDYAWTGWKRFDVLPVTFTGPAATSSSVKIESYNNTSSIRLGAEYTMPQDGWKLRVGFTGIASAAPPETVTPLLPEQDRAYGTLGLGIPLNKSWAIDAAYAHIWTSGARGRIVDRTTTVNNTATAAQLNSGVFDLSANIFSITIKASY